MSPDGKKKWAFKAGDQISAPFVGKDGEVYATATDVGRLGEEGGRLFKLTAGGAKKSKDSVAQADNTKRADGPDGTIYTAGRSDNPSSAEQLVAASPNGKQEWSYKLGPEEAINWISVDNGAVLAVTYYTTGNHGNRQRLYVLDPNGKLRWWREFEWGVTAASMDKEGFAYVASNSFIGDPGFGQYTGWLAKYDKKGAETWTFDLGRESTSLVTVARDDKGNTYLGTGSGGVYAIGTDGSKKWMIEVSDEIGGIEMMKIETNTLFVGSRHMLTAISLR
ncbi:MAG: outer membrane protein assembly factor BamB family protein [Candidatus Aquicultorales bacterium]